MRHVALVALIALTWTAGPALAADFGGAADTGAWAASEDATKAAQIATQFEAGKYDEVIEAAKVLLRTAKDEAAKTEAARLVAESLRKKEEWKLAAGAYLKLRDRFGKTSDQGIKADAIAEILQASPAGKYAPLEAASGAAAPADGTGSTGTTANTTATSVPNLADDAYLNRALACLALQRLEKVKARLPALKRGQNPQEIVAALAAMAEEVRQLRLLADDVPAEPERIGTQTVGMRLAEVSRQVLATLKAKLAEFQRAIKASTLTAVQRKEMDSCHDLCTSLAKTEGDFRATMDKMAGLDGWMEGSQFGSDSADRQAAYTKMADSLVPPPSDAARRAMDWGGRGGGGGGGGPGGW